VRHINTLENLLWITGTALKILLCAAIFYRRVYQRMPFFAAYAVLLVCEVVFVWTVYQIYGYTSRTAWYAYWTASGIVLLARGFVIAELCWITFRLYPGVWSLARRTLSLSAIALFVLASISAAMNSYWIVGLVETTQRGLELVGSIILLLALTFSVRYEAWKEPMEHRVLVGLTVYSIVEMLNHTFMSFVSTAYLSLWNSARIGVFDIAVGGWIYCLRKPLAISTSAPVLLTDTATTELLTELLNGMRELTDDLKKVGKAVWK